MKIAIVGGGAAGLGAAWALSSDHDVTIFEASERLGGHAHTYSLDYSDRVIDVDTGFIIYNEPNYPNLTALFKHLHVETNPVDMSFSVSGASSLKWTSDFRQLLTFEGLANFDLKFIVLAKEIIRFNQKAKRDLRANKVPDVSLNDYVELIGGGSLLKENYLVPIGAAIWSMPSSSIMSFPAVVFLNFFDNHTLLDTRKSKWRTIAGGSNSYLEKLAHSLKAEICLSEAVQSVQRNSNSVSVTTNKIDCQIFDHIIFACHPDEALEVIESPTSQEVVVLGNIPYAENRVVLHRDSNLMPRLRCHWASWNCIVNSYTDDKNFDSITITYNMNRLQKIDQSYPLFITVQPHREPREDLVFAEFLYHHPQYTKEAVEAQSKIFTIQGQNRTTYAGAYLGTGFHEDAFGSGIHAAASIGSLAPLSLKWEQPPYIMSSMS